MGKEKAAFQLLLLATGTLGFQLARSNNSITRASSTTSTALSSTPGNPFTSLIGDLASTFTKSGKMAQGNPELDSSLQNMCSGWSEIQAVLKSKQTPEELAFRDNLKLGYGEGSPLHKVRLYDESNKEEDIRVTFYRDSASWCPYCQKVWFALEEKKIPYKVEKVNMNCYGDKPRSFLQIQPNGQIPVATIDGTTYRSSNEILYVLEEMFPKHKSLRPPPGKEMLARELLDLESAHAGAWLGWLRGGGGGKDRYEFVLDRMEKALTESDGDFFLGKDVTMVDVQFLSFLERACASLLFFKGYQIRVAPGTKTKYPAINKWFDALETKPSYQLTKSDYYTHNWDLPPQLGGCSADSFGEEFRKAINGKTPGTWDLPLKPHNGGIEPDWEWAGDENAAKKEAVERVSANHEAIVNFAARGAGKKGMPPVMAPLADPNATPSDAVQPGVDSVLQTVSLALLEGVDQQEDNMKNIASTIVSQGGKEYNEGVIESIVYLRDRIGVPRDMKLPAARQLRAHLNWSLEKLVAAANNA